MHSATHGREITYLPPMLRYRFHLRLSALASLCFAGLLMLFGACAPAPPIVLQIPDMADDGVWEDQARIDIAYLDGPEVEGRQTATRGFFRAAAYLSARMDESGLQPVLVDEYRMQYAARLRRATDLSVQVIGEDTTVVRQGNDFLVTGAPQPLDVSGTVPTLPVLDWIQWSEDIRIDMGSESTWRMVAEVEAYVSTAPMHIVGMLPGADPVRRDSLTLIVAPVDGAGLQGAESWTDGGDLTLPAAAVLSVMRRMASYQNRWSLYPESTMFSLLSGTRDGCLGPEQFLRNAPWDRSRISRIIVVTMQADATCDWPGLLNGIADDQAHAPNIVRFRAYAPFEAQAASGFGSWRMRSSIQQTDALNRATTEAIRLAREIMAIIP